MKTSILVATASFLLMACSASKTEAQSRPAAAAKAPANDKAPDTYRVNFDTSKGLVVMEVTRASAPIGADRFYNLVRAKFFDGARFFRVVPNFVVQFGIAGDPKVTKAWDVSLQDDPVKETNARGTICFAATSQPNSRTTQMFINLNDNGRLDQMGFAVFGKVVSGMEAVDQIYAGYGEAPDQGRITNEGTPYIEKNFPNLDYVKTARIAQ